uniref:Putative secreted protein n=1 Tax=Amblyomma triste TaxID=251400 RepID=A0A023G8R8_AMBTT
MIAISLAICALTVQNIVFGVLYEDNPLYFKHQRADFVTDAGDLLFVLRQSLSPVLYPVTPCQALKKIGQIGENAFRYKVFYSPPGWRYRIVSFITTMTESITALHRHNNVLIYQTTQGGPFIPFKVLYADVQTGCYIFVFNQRGFGRVCRLLRKSSRASSPVPQACWRVYSSNCPADDMTIYERHCGYQISHLAR